MIGQKKILIGLRKNDPYIKHLSWVFPGGRPEYDENLEDALKRSIKTKTGLDVTVKKLIFAKTYPEKPEFLSLYYYCEVGEGEAKAGEKLQVISVLFRLDDILPEALVP